MGNHDHDINVDGSQSSQVPGLLPASVSSSESQSSFDYMREFDVPTTNAGPALPNEIHPSRRKVTFGEVGIRNYPVILGDHPDCIGPPVSAWGYSQLS